MEFEKNAKTYGKNIYKNVVMHILSTRPCDTFFNNFMPHICLNFVMEKNQFCHVKLIKIHTVE